MVQIEVGASPGGRGTGEQREAPEGRRSPDRPHGGGSASAVSQRPHVRERRPRPRPAMAGTTYAALRPVWARGGRSTGRVVAVLAPLLPSWCCGGNGDSGESVLGRPHGALLAPDLSLPGSLLDRVSHSHRKMRTTSGYSNTRRYPRSSSAPRAHRRATMRKRSRLTVVHLLPPLVRDGSARLCSFPWSAPPPATCWMA